MFSHAKPLASLSGGLLARKGAARPAMRPQGYASLAPTSQQLEDLGWDDMGAEPVPAPTMPAQLTPMAVAEVERPPVLVEREALAQVITTPVEQVTQPIVEQPVEQLPNPAVASALEAPRVTYSVSVATAGRLSRETAHLGRSAFTLRLDAGRHLRLRLASALAHRSAQQLVQHALDQFLATLPEVDALVTQLPEQKPTRTRRKGKA